MGDVSTADSQILLFLLAGAIIHGFWLAILLLLGNKRSGAKLFLSIALLCLSLHLVSYLLFLTGMIRLTPHFFGIPYPFLYLIGPAFYFFHQYALSPGFQLRHLHGWHLLPFAVILLGEISFFGRSAEEKLELIDKIIGHENTYTWEGLILSNGVFFFTMVYVAASYLQARQVEQEQQDTLNRSNARWLKNFSLAFLFLLAVDTGVKFSFFALSMNAVNMEFLLTALFAFALHVLGFYVQSGSLEIPSVSGVRVRGKYKHSPLGTEQLAAYEQLLVKIMEEERIFLDPELKHGQMAARLNIPAAYLSQLLNEQMHTTFYDFINCYRVRAVKEKLQQKEYAHFSLLAIALDSGFTNKTTFNRTFKKFTGQTPSEFLKQQQ